jgi:hypothetical protein
VCVVITVDMEMLLRYFQPYGIILITVFYCFRFFRSFVTDNALVSKVIVL